MNMFTPWPSMKTFLSVQHQQRNHSNEASSSNVGVDPNILAASPGGAAGVYLRANLKLDLETQERIAVHLHSCDIMLDGEFNAETGFSLHNDIHMSRPLLTKRGKVVPKSYTRLSKTTAVGRTTPRMLHLYSHPYEDLAGHDLLKYLVDEVKELPSGHGVFGIACFGESISFSILGASPSGWPA